MMHIAHELGKSMQELYQMSREELGWWFAYFQRKAEIEKKAAEEARRKGRRGRRSA